METQTPGTYVDPYLFDAHLRAFKDFVVSQSGIPFESFASSLYIKGEEGYKRVVYDDGRVALGYGDWSDSSVGSGEILDSAIDAIEVPSNNLVQWQARYGEDHRGHQPLYNARDDANETNRVERCLFNLYRGSDPQDCFEQLVANFGRKYPLIAYLFFLKDCSKYLPIAPDTFERSFAYLGIDFKASHRCSWENYQTFIRILHEVRQLLAERLSSEVTLLDAHSFAFMLARQMEKHSALPDTREYQNLSPTERDAVVKARIGQGRFRQSLIDFWKGCAVTDLGEAALLRASHIIPWADADVVDRTSFYNGLLLAPHLDAAFDSGFVSFDDDGGILISENLSQTDIESLGIHSGMRLRTVMLEHRKYLAYHRKHIFKG